MPEANLSIVRAGITIYGIYPSAQVETDIVRLDPVMELKSHVTYVKDVEPGTAISYGGTFAADRKLRVATVPVGYADGYPRQLSNKGMDTDPWTESTDPGKNLYGPVYGGCDRYSGCVQGR